MALSMRRLWGLLRQIKAVFESTKKIAASFSLLVYCRRHAQHALWQQRSGLLSHSGIATFQRGLGSSPNISGAYKASARVTGMAKSPTLFKRMVYSTSNVPLGR